MMPRGGFPPLRNVAWHPKEPAASGRTLPSYLALERQKERAPPLLEAADKDFRPRWQCQASKGQRLCILDILCPVGY